MGYEVLCVTGDGDCFFHVAALHLYRRKHPIPPFWLYETPGDQFGLWRPTYHSQFEQDAGNLRWSVARWASVQLFGKGVPFEDLIDAVHRADLNRIDTLPFPRFDDRYPFECFLDDAGEEIATAWNEANEKKDTKLRQTRLAAFFVYWYGLQFDEIQSDKKWTRRAQAFGLELKKQSIYGAINPNVPSWRADAGIAPSVLYELHDLDLRVVTEATDFFGQVTVLSELQKQEAPDEVAYLLIRSNLHYDAVIWCAHEEDTAIINDRVFGTLYTPQPEPFPFSGFLSLNRGDEASQRGELMIGLGVWNVNHLGKAKQADTKLAQLNLRVQPSRKKKVEVDYRVGDDPFEEQSGAHRQSDDTKNIRKIQGINNLVKNNRTWLDLLALNEVNTGIDRLAFIENCKLYRGPHLVSMGPKSDVGQQEYYPLLIVDRPRDFTIRHIGCSAYFAGRDYRPDVDEGQSLNWMKSKNKEIRRGELRRAERAQAEEDVKKKPKGKKAVKVESKEPEPPKRYFFDDLPSYRPVVIHRLLIDEGKKSEVIVNVGIVHTTPGGTEFERYEVYAQLDEFFKAAHSGKLDAWGSKSENLWLVAGDYYLLDESLVVKGQKVDPQDLRDAQYDAGRALQELLPEFAKLSQEHSGLPDVLKELSEQKAEQGSKQQSLKRRHDDVPKKLAPAVEAASRRVLVIKELKQLDADFVDLKEKMIALSQREFKDEAERLNLMLELHERYLSKLNLASQMLKAESQWSKYGTILVEKPVDSKDEDSSESEEDAENDEVDKASAKDDDEADEYVSPEGFFTRNRALAKTLRHRLRNILHLTFHGHVSQWFDIIQTIWGTNIHTSATLDPGGDGVEYTSFRLADFVVCSKAWKSRDIGIFDRTSKVIRVDDSAVPTSLFWRAISDHFPIGGRFSLKPADYRVELVFIDEIDLEKRKAKIVMYLLDLNSQLPENERVEEELHTAWGPDEFPKSRDEKQNWKDSKDVYGHLFEVLQERIHGFFDSDKGDWPEKATVLTVFKELTFDSTPEEVYNAILPLATRLANRQMVLEIV